MTSAIVFKAVQAGILGLMVYIVIKVFAERFKRQKEERTGKKAKPFLEALKRKVEGKRRGIGKDEEWVVIDDKVPNDRMSTPGDDGVPQGKS